MTRRVLSLLVALGLSAFAARAVDEAKEIPALGLVLGEFPPGDGKPIAEAACLKCHSADMVLQQRLTEKQWAKEIDKMAGWGAELPEEKKPALLGYLVRSFGPANAWKPPVSKPASR
ncbi:MAG TPA: hypothetical protein VGR00_07575 [Thermoanaerobaculia bacterium]|nr:hypothetical protein [Thermoanaerobaculia bacterium]